MKKKEVSEWKKDHGASFLIIRVSKFPNLLFSPDFCIPSRYLKPEIYINDYIKIPL